MTIDTGGDFGNERDLDGGFLKADEHRNHCKAKMNMLGIMMIMTIMIWHFSHTQ